MNGSKLDKEESEVLDEEVKEESIVLSNNEIQFVINNDKQEHN